MNAPAGTHGVISLAALDLRRRPDHRSELRSQLLLGEVVRALGSTRDGQWWRVENGSDGYRGWVRTWGIVPASAARAARWESMARARVARPYVEALARPTSATLVSPLFLNSRVIAGARAGRFRAVELPDGRRGWIPATALRSGRAPRLDVAARVRGLLGVPYLWGGRTPHGFDCSGFTQQVMLEQGVMLPRDAGQQFRVCERLAAAREPRVGDLLFFGRPGEPVSHVGLALGGGYFAHAQGRVRISSLESDNRLCDNVLSRQFRGFGRPLRTPLDRKVRRPGGRESP